MIHTAPISAPAPSHFQGNAAIPDVAAAPPLSGAPGGAWAKAARIPIAYDARTRKLDPDPAVAYAETSGKMLYIAWVVPQRAKITAQQRQNDAGLGNDDTVIVYLFPSGPNGFEYAFFANPIGTHSAFSSENTSFAPSWTSTGHVTKDGYVVYMKIPLGVMKGAHSGVWRANFRRYVSATLDDYDWSYNAQTVAGNDPQPITAGTISGLPLTQVSARPKPRFGVYALGEAAASSVGGSTSRMGLDASIPLTDTTSFVSTIHPDYSNVEIDQATISPTAFPRYFNDVRPFFTQLQNYYNTFSCYSCTSVSPLYTTSIPTPRYGNAVEGRQGPFAFAGFDAQGAGGRDDNAEVVNFASRDQKLNLSAQRVGVSLPSLVDDTMLESANYDSQKGFVAATIQSQERGTLVNDPGAGLWSEYGIGTYDKTAGAYLTWQRIGAQYSPFDGYVPNNGMAGYSESVSKTWYLNSHATIPRVLFYDDNDEFKRSDGTIGQADHQFAVGADFQHLFGMKPLVHLRWQTGSSWVQLADGNLVSASQNGFDLVYNYRTSVQDYLSFYTGRFGPGTLDYWTRILNFRLTNDLTLTLEADDGDQRLDDGERNKQWLDRGSLVWQQSKNESVSLGVRRIIGPSPIIEFGQPTLSYAAWNLSAGFYKRLPHDEFYIVYGDPSQLTTYPAFFVKYIHYFGAEKGV